MKIIPLSEGTFTIDKTKIFKLILAINYALDQEGATHGPRDTFDPRRPLFGSELDLNVTHETEIKE